VHKRLGTRLRKLRKDMTCKKLSDGKVRPWEGNRCWLTSCNCTLVSLTIQRNGATMQEKKHRVWSTFFHTLSAADNPRHEQYQHGRDSRFIYKKMQLDGSMSTIIHFQLLLLKLWNPNTQNCVMTCQPVLSMVIDTALIRVSNTAYRKTSNNFVNVCFEGSDLFQ